MNKGILLAILAFQFSIFFLSAIKDLRKKNQKELGFGKLQRVILSLSMVGTAWIMFQFSPNIFYSTFILIGMIFSFFGDLIMGSIIKTINRLVYGMTVFSFAHISYIIAHLIYANKNNNSALTVFTFILIFILLLLPTILIGISKATPYIKHSKAYTRKFAIIYGCIIFLMFLSTLFIYLSLGRYWWIASFSAIMFMLSDGIIALKDILNKRIIHSEYLIWITYVIGQMGIICGILY